MERSRCDVVGVSGNLSQTQVKLLPRGREQEAEVSLSRTREECRHAVGVNITDTREKRKTEPSRHPKLVVVCCESGAIVALLPREVKSTTLLTSDVSKR